MKAYGIPNTLRVIESTTQWVIIADIKCVVGQLTILTNINENILHWQFSQAGKPTIKRHEIKIFDINAKRMGLQQQFGLGELLINYGKAHKIKESYEVTIKYQFL